jgi:hypothetical protein
MPSGHGNSQAELHSNQYRKHCACARIHQAMSLKCDGNPQDNNLPSVEWQQKSAKHPPLKRGLDLAQEVAIVFPFL